MHKFKHISLLFLLLTFHGYFLSTTHAQTGRYYSTDEGLSSSLINQIYQDSRGYIWTATEYGLNRFDGVRFVNYQYMAGDAEGIKSNYIRTLYETKTKTLFIGCLDGLMRYNPDTDTFREIPMMRNGKQVFPHITRIKELGNGEMWICSSGQGLFKLDQTTQIAYSLDELLGEANYNFQSVFYEDLSGNIWIGTEGNGLICYLTQTKAILTFKHPAINDNTIATILEDNEGNLFVGTQKQGLSCYDRFNNRFVPIHHADGKVLSVYCLAVVKGQLLIGTDGQGLMYYEPETKQIKDFIVNSAPFDFSDGKVHSILKDRDDNLWVGLFQKGIVLLPNQENLFQYMGAKSLFYNPIGQRCVMALFQTKDGHIWVGTDNEGVYELDRAGRCLNHYRMDQNSHSLGHTVMAIFEDSQDNLWVGSYNHGLMRLNRKTGKFDFPLSLQSEKVMSIIEDHDKNLYIATLGAGFYQYNLLTETLSHYESSKDESGDVTRNELANDWVNTLFCSNDGLIWIGHYRGVSCFNPLTQGFLDINKTNTPINDGVGYALHEDSSGSIWAGTTGGLICLNRTEGVKSKFTTTDGLSNNIVCGICEDDENNLWISTYKGISKLDQKDGRFINYYVGDGLQGNEFTHGAYCRTEDGMLYFGGLNGITHFYPKDIKSNSKVTEVLITDFYLFNSPINKNTTSAGDPIIYTSVQQSNIFQLHHKDNTFSIVFSTLQYNNPEQITYQYKIDELSQHWSSTEPGENRITYNNLPHGRYTFSVRALNHGEYSNTRTISIIITPPWYQTWWAQWIYLFLFLVLIYGIVSIIKSRIQHKRELMMSEHTAQINEAKLQFFINISHEIRTPMTLIINPIEKLLSQTKEGAERKTYMMIYRNSQRILRLINQLMDVRKLDKGQMHMKFRETDMVCLIRDVMTTFDYAAQRKHIHFEFEHVEDQLMAWVDLNNFDKVLMNILSNAFKYTEENGEVKIALSTGVDTQCKGALSNYLQIVVSDTGIGIDETKIEAIFERFYQIDNDKSKVNMGTGIGLHLCRSLVQLHHGVIYAENRRDIHGCRIIVRIPQGKAHLSVHELEIQSSQELKKTRPSTLPLEEQIDMAEDAFEAKTHKSKTKLKLMVVEDETEIQDYLKEELAVDYKVTVCNNGKEAYEKMLLNVPDLVISDVMMPEMDGFTLCRKIKQNTTINHVPVILLTARSSSADTMEGIDMGADAYMVKPFDTELLKRTIGNLISNRKMLRSKYSGAQEQEDKIDKLDLKSVDEQLMEKVMRVVNEHIANPEFNVEMLAAEVGMSRVHIYRKLKELTNLSARDFIRNIRLQQAANLLRTDKKLSVSDVAYATGHTNLSHFSNSFKGKYGMSPTEYSMGKNEEPD